VASALLIVATANHPEEPCGQIADLKQATQKALPTIQEHLKIGAGPSVEKGRAVNCVVPRNDDLLCTRGGAGFLPRDVPG
jgi:hypothetical protein